MSLWYECFLPELPEKPNQRIHFCLRGNGCLFMWGAYFHMGAYKRDVVVEMGAYIHGSMGVYYLDFTI